MVKNCEKNHVVKEVPHSRNKSYDILLRLIDIFISSVVIAPCVIAYWRGTWVLIELLVWPQNLKISSMFSFGLGCFGHMFFALCQNILKKSFDPDKKRLTYYVASRCYTAVFGFVCVNMWRGVWNLCDYLTSKNSLVVIIVVTILPLVVLTMIRTTRNLTATPFVVSTDQKQLYFEISTIFDTQRFHRPFLYILDTFFSAIIVGTLVVIAWRGVWEILDLTLYRNNKFVSATGSLTIGYGIVIILFAVQPILQHMLKSLSGKTRLIVADAYYLISFIGAVNVWRGIWLLLEVFLYPENLLKSCLISHVVPFLILTILNCANSILVRGVALDGEDEHNSWVEFSIAYVHLGVQKQRTRKHLEKKLLFEEKNYK